MSSPPAAAIESLDKETIIDNASDVILDTGSNDDQDEDAETDQVFADDLDHEIQSGNTIVCEPEEHFIYDDDEKDSNDSGIEDNSTPDVDQKSSISPLPSSPVTVTPVLGRGRYVKKAVDKDNKELPAPGIRNVEPEDGFYQKFGKMATLPPSYYRKREGPEIKRVPRRVDPLINFRASFKQISFIVDKDDSKEKGYQHARKRLEKIFPELEFDTSKPQHDIWSFGLYIYTLKLLKTISCSLLDLFPEEINNEENRPFWFMFKNSPTFQDPILRNTIPSDPDPRKGTLLTIDRTSSADLSYGALTTMSRFHIHKDFIFRKKTRWTFRFHDEFFEIQTNVFQKGYHNNTAISSQVKYKITLDIIDRAAIFHLWKDGFSLHLNMKGNVHELHRERKPEIDKNDAHRFTRQGIFNKKPMPLFSTIRIRLRLKDDTAIIEGLERAGKIRNDTSAAEKEELKKSAYDESLKSIREIFKCLLDFFYKNRIHVCFGPVATKNISLDQLNTLYYQRFPTFVQSYSWAMLCSISFRVQVQLFCAKGFLDRLHDYSKLLDDEKTPSDCDDRFYRLCLYLHRRSSEYFFLDLNAEIQIGIEQYHAKYQRFKNKSLEIPKFDKSTGSTAYIPSVVLTPTTISIRTLKMCKLNRVLREKRFGGCLNFVLVELRDEAYRLLFPSEFRALKKQIHNYLTNGFNVTPTRLYKYLHHSQSQVKCKQFWFYYHDKENGYLSHEDAYTWMGNFDKERVVAKHAARIALCFTSTDATIQITAEKVTYDRDVKDATKTYAFTDGVGTISSKLRDEIQEFLKRRSSFSVLQIRYGGCKGTLSVDPRLDGQQYQIRFRDSMNKFTSDHDIMEICKLSAPRALYLNRQDIVLLESRDIPHTNFLLLQNRDHLWLVRALLIPAIAYELLQEKLLPVFKLHKIARNVNIVEEQFFLKLIITCAFNIIRELLDRTRIRLSDKKGRNMFGIVDEYGILEYGQVFFQYSTMRDNKLYPKNEDGEKFNRHNFDECTVFQGKVVITKNPCHHPGDLRTFEAIDCPQLRHLKDVIVFPQKGPRPHPNEISGSDLDGDEYVVIWHEDLIPETENETPYAYDSQEDPPKMDRPITREDINRVVMDVSEQDCLGSLSNIHLAYVDKQGIKSEICTKLAGAISQEVDATKTGKHPLTDEEIAALRAGLDNKWPDFMKSRGKKDYYPSERVLGKLYRSARRSVMGWSRAISNHGNPRYIHLALALAAGTDVKDEENYEEKVKIKSSTTYDQPLDPHIYYPNYKKYLADIKQLYKVYENELLEIISLYHFQDEIDLLCRCDAMDAPAGGAKKSSLEDSAAIEVQNLIERIKRDFYSEFDKRREQFKCCEIKQIPDSNRRKIIDCQTCGDGKLAKAACAYIYTYQQNNSLALKSNRRILSFPWLFADHLVKLKYLNRPKNFVDQSNTVVGRAFSLYLDDFTPKFKVFIPENSTNISVVQFNYKKVEEKRTSLLLINKNPDETIDVPLIRACFVEILNDWLIKQKIFGETCDETAKKPLIPESIWHELIVQFLTDEYRPNVRLILASKTHNLIIERYRQTIDNYRRTWTNTEYFQLYKMFQDLHNISVKRIKESKLTIWTYLHEYIILALQCIGIEKRLVDKWICPESSS